MNHYTHAEVFAAPAAQLFAFLSDVQNLSKWATGFAKAVKNVDGETKVITPQGEIFFFLKADPATGTIDMYGGPEKTRLAYYPSRVISLPDGRSAYIFTNFQWPGLPDAVFAAQNATLGEEFANIRRHLENPAE